VADMIDVGKLHLLTVFQFLTLRKARHPICIRMDLCRTSSRLLLLSILTCEFLQ